MGNLPTKLAEEMEEEAFGRGQEGIREGGEGGQDERGSINLQKAEVAEEEKEPVAV